MLIEREVGRVHAERLGEATRRPRRDHRIRGRLARRLHRFADRIEPERAPRHAAYTGC